MRRAISRTRLVGALKVAFASIVVVSLAIAAFLNRAAELGTKADWLRRHSANEAELRVGTLVVEFRRADGTGERPGPERPFVVTFLSDDHLTLAGPLGTYAFAPDELAALSVLRDGEEHWLGREQP